MTITLDNDVVERLLAAAEQSDDLTSDQQAAITQAAAALVMSDVDEDGENGRLLEWMTLRGPLRELMRMDTRARAKGPTQADLIGEILDEAILGKHGVTYDPQPVAAGGVVALSMAIRFSDKMLQLGRSDATVHRYLVSTLNPVLVSIGRHAPDGLYGL